MRKPPRLFVTALAALGLVLAPVAAIAQDVSATAPAQLTAEDFTRDGYMSPPQLSPDGLRLAWVEGNVIIVYNLEDGSEKRTSSQGNSLDSVEWVGNGYIIAYIKRDRVVGNDSVKIFDYPPLVLNRDGKLLRLLVQRGDAKVTEGDLKPILRYIDGPKPYAITLNNGFTSMLDVATGKYTSGERLMPGSSHYFDSQGRERMSITVMEGKVSYGSSSVIFHFRVTPGAKPDTLKLPEQDKIYYGNFAYSEFDNSIYWSEVNYQTSLTTIYRHDLATGQRSVYRTGPDKEMSLAFDKYGHIVGITTVRDRVETEWTDPQHLKMVGAVQKLFPDALVDIVDMTRDGRHIVFLISAPEAPDSYYYYSDATKDMVRIGGTFPQFDGQPLGAMTYITYKARDGLEIPAYVTKRRDTPAHAPLVVMPHGGPAWRDSYGFSAQVQYFAARGYVVLQPQYRGSTGFGEAFERAGNGDLAGMNNDLEDGVRFLQAQGMIDPKKVCVVGWSWGGYLAQAALTFTPDTYVCGVSGAGVSDLFDSLSADNDISWGGYYIEYWRSIIGHERRDADEIRATSPIEHVEAIKAPLLLIHGERDYRVSHYQSRRMNAAMKRAGKDVTYIPVEFMGHSPVGEAERLMVMKATGDFVARAFGETAAP